MRLGALLLAASTSLPAWAQGLPGAEYSRAYASRVSKVQMLSPSTGTYSSKSAPAGAQGIVEVRLIATARTGQFGPVPLSVVRLEGEGLKGPGDAPDGGLKPFAVGTLSDACTYIDSAAVSPGVGSTIELNDGGSITVSNSREVGTSFSFAGSAVALCLAFLPPRTTPSDLSLSIGNANMLVLWASQKGEEPRKLDLPKPSMSESSEAGTVGSSTTALKWVIAAVLLGIAVVLYLLRRRLRQGIKSARAVIRAAAIAGHGPAVPELEGETPPLASESNRNLVEAGADGLSDAQLALQNGDFELAERRLQEALGRSLSPEQVALAHLMMGGTALARGNLVDAASAFYRCVTGDRLYQQSGVPAAANLEAIYRCLGMPRGADRAHRIVALIPGQLEQLPQQQIARIRQLARPIRWRWRLYGLRAWPQALSSFVQAVLAAPAAEAATDPQ